MCVLSNPGWLSSASNFLRVTSIVGVRAPNFENEKDTSVGVALIQYDLFRFDPKSGSHSSLLIRHGLLQLSGAPCPSLEKAGITLVLNGKSAMQPILIEWDQNDVGMVRRRAMGPNIAICEATGFWPVGSGQACIIAIQRVVLAIGKAKTHQIGNEQTITVIYPVSRSIF